MDLGIKGKKAIVCAASKGLGKGCAVALAREGVAVTICARTDGPLQQTADEIRKLGVSVTALALDVTTEAGRAALLKACPDPDILVNNAGGPPPGNFRDWTREDWIKALDANMLTGIELMKATIDKMAARNFGRIVNITSSAVKAPIDVLGLSNGARTGLTGFMAGIARAIAKHGVTINNLLPGPFDTDRLRGTMAARGKMNNRSAEEESKIWAAMNPAGRFGTAAEFGATCAFLCSVHAGYINGQNVLMDGGQYPGTF